MKKTSKMNTNLAIFIFLSVTLLPRTLMASEAIADYLKQNSTQVWQDCESHATSDYCLFAIGILNGENPTQSCNQIVQSCEADGNEGGFVCQKVGGACINSGIVDSNLVDAWAAQLTDSAFKTLGGINNGVLKTDPAVNVERGNSKTFRSPSNPEFNAPGTSLRGATAI